METLKSVMKISDIKPYPKNAKRHPQKHIQQVANSIKEFGMNQAIVVDKQGVIIVGHGRYEASKLLGIEPEIKVVDLTEEQAKAYRLADNKLNESEWDMGLAIEELKGLSPELFDLTGFDKDLLIEPDEKDDIIPENAPARSKLGDLYELGTHRVLCGDSTQPEAVLRLMDGKKADMVYIDPPYGIDLNTDYSKMNSKLEFVQDKHLKSKSGNKYDKVIGDDREYDIEHIFRDFGYCGEVFIWGGDYFLKQLPLGGMFVWDKRGNETFDKMWGSGFELCWSRQKHKRDIIRKTWAGVFGTEKEDVRRRIHPTQKPLELCKFFLDKFSEEGKLIVDLFLGSGSTLIACEKTGRICYGMEIDCHYTDVIVQRFVDYTGIEEVKKNGIVEVWKQSQKN